MHNILIVHSSTKTWTELLPMVMLGIRATVEEDLHCSPAELVYDTTLRLPGELSPSCSSNSTFDISSYLSRFTDHMRNIKAQQTRQTTKPSYIPKELFKLHRVTQPEADG